MTHGMASSLLALRAGRLLRDARRIIGLSQRDLERRTGISQSAQSRFERGLPSSIGFAQVEHLADALGGRVGLTFEAPFLADRAAQRDRLHARCVGYVAARLAKAGWHVETEVEIEGSLGPGWIDVLAFHPQAGRLLVIEIKTEIGDLGRIQRTLAWYESRARTAAIRHGWRAKSTHAALLVLATAAADLALRQNRGLTESAFPSRARRLSMLVTSPATATVSRGRSVAMLDPLDRRASWIRGTRLDGNRAPLPYADYADAARRLTSLGRPRRRA